MCEKCEERERMTGISCALSSASKGSENEKIMDANRVVEDYEAETKKIDAELQKRHKEVINGYDKQVEDNLKDLATFTTKMLIMFEDYKKKGDVDGMIDILESIRNYGQLAQVAASVLISTSDSLLSKMRGAQ